MRDKSQIEQWLTQLVQKLKNSFGTRLLLVVHVGSWARNDANEQSDIDVNVILDKVMPEDISSYRTIIGNMPDKQLACGFLGGLNEIKLWPRYDLTAFYYGSQVLYGNVSEVIGAISQKDVFDNAMIMVSNINHAVRHTMIYDEISTETADAMKELYKASFFVMQGWYLLMYGDYISKIETMTKNAAFNEDKLILERFQHWDENQRRREENPIETLALLERWSSGMFDRLEGIHIKL